MKSLVEFITENLNKKQRTSLVKAIESKNPDTFITVCQMIVDDNKNDLIDSTDIDDMEDGMLIGYLTNNENETIAQIASVVKTNLQGDPRKDGKQWFILTVDGRKRSSRSNQFDVEIIDGEKLHGNYFGNAWKIIYDEHVDDDVVDAIINNHFKY